VILSEKAKDLAALKAWKAAQEEATETLMAKSKAIPKRERSGVAFSFNRIPVSNVGDSFLTFGVVRGYVPLHSPGEKDLVSCDISTKPPFCEPPSRYQLQLLFQTD
jgi:hypothetical protein